MTNPEIRGYAQEAYLELGRGVDRRFTENIVLDIVESWNTAKAQLKRPMAILIGGFQGSGKTTTIKAFNSDLQLPTIASDEIRYRLLQRSMCPSEKEFRPQVFAIRNNLISFAAQNRASFILDQIITPARIHLVENILRKNNKESYMVLKILLTAPLEVLKERVLTRPPLVETYKGTVEELEDTILKYGGFDPTRFHRVFNTGKLLPDDIAKEIKQMIISFQT